MRGWDRLASLVSSLWSTFNGKRDLAAALGYRQVLDYDGYLGRYARGGIAGRIVEIPPEATWDTLPRLTDDEQLESETALSRKFRRLSERVQLRRMLEKADVLAGIGRYSVLLIGFDDKRALDQPVEAGSVGADGVLYVQPFSEMNALPIELDLDPTSPNYGRPSIYQVDLSHGLLNDTGLTEALLRQRVRKSFNGPTTRRVHASRLVHIAEGTLEDDLYGRPRLRRVWDLLDDLAKTVGGSAEVFWLVANRGMQIDVDKELSLNDEDKADLEEQIEEYEHGQRRFFRTRGVRVLGLNELGSGNVNPRQVFSVIAALIVGATGIPYRMLFGTERGQNINVQDRKAWLEQVAGRREAFANEVVLRPLIEKIAYAGALPNAATDAKLIWPMIHDDMHRAEVADVIARGEANHAKARNLGGAVLSTSEYRSLYLGLSPEKPDDPQDEEKPKPAPEKPAVVPPPSEDTPPADQPDGADSEAA